MISFNYETDFLLENEAHYEAWISRIIESEGFEEGEINYIFCDDEYLHKTYRSSQIECVSFESINGKQMSPTEIGRGGFW